MNDRSNIWFLIPIPLCVTFCKLSLYLLGDWLEGSKLTDVIKNGKIRTGGSSKAILSATHVKETRYVHQGNVSVLHSKLKESFDDSGHIYFEEWIDKHRKKSPHFEFSYALLELQCLMLMFVRNVRSSNFETFVEVLDQFLQSIFSLNHTHYARCLTIYIQTLKKLPDQHPEVYKEL